MGLRAVLVLIMFLTFPLSPVLASGTRSPEMVPHADPGARVFYAQGAELWVMNLDGSGPTRLAGDMRPSGSACPPFFLSPNGRYVAYQRNDSQLAIVDSTSGQSWNIAAGDIGSVSWSPDNQNVTFTLDSDIYLHDVGRGGPPEAIAAGGSRFLFPAFSPNGQQIAFLESAGGNTFSVTTVHIANRDWRNLGTTAPSALGEGSLCPSIVNWSPDSTRLLVDYGEPVFVFYLAGGTPTQVGGMGDTASHFWSPAGNELALKERDGTLWLVNPDGSGQRPLVAEPVGAIAWDPARRPLIAYTTASDLWIINTQNGQKQQLTADDDFREISPAWAPDGSTLIFERRGQGGEGQGIWRVSADGSGLTQISGSGSALQIR